MDTKITKLKPRGNRVLIRIKMEETVTSGGLILVTKTDQKTEIGTVVDFGELVNKVKPGESQEFVNKITIGDDIVFDKFSGVQIKFNGIDYLIIEDRFIIAFVKKYDAIDETNAVN